MVMVVIAVVIMTVPPVPIALLVFFRKMAIIAVRIAMDLNHPLVVIAPLAIVPTMAVVIIGIACVVVARTAGSRKRQCQRSAYKQGSDVAVSTLHELFS